MDLWTTLTQLFLAVVLGGVIGLEREVNEKKQASPEGKLSAIVGVRSFSFVALLGAIIGLLYFEFTNLSLLFGGAFLLLLLMFYHHDSTNTKDAGITTELALIFSFIIGNLLTLQVLPVQLILAITVVVILLLSQKEKIKHVVEDIRKQEINAFISFAIIAIVILPFLPNQSYAIADIPGIQSFLENFDVNVQKILAIDMINPFKLWLIVALITGVDFIGYVLEKIFGSKKGWLLTSAVGGFVSSTATTQSLAQESKHKSQVNHLVSAALVANLVSFIQIAILIGAINSVLLIKLFPILLMMFVAAGILLFYFLHAKDEKALKEEKATTNKQKNIIDIGAAIKFAFLFLVINIVSKISLELFGESAFLLTTGIGAVIGLDAVMINTAQLAGTHIDYTLAAFAFILANAVNLFGKSIYSFTQGKKEFAVRFLMSVTIIVITSLLGVFFV